MLTEMQPKASITYDDFASELVAHGILVDPYQDGRPRLDHEPVVLAEGQFFELCDAAEALSALYNELALLVFEDPSLLDTVLGLTPWQKLMWASSAPDWHHHARADLFFTAGGIKACELNSDTPTGQAEATLLGRIARRTRTSLLDPNEHYEARFVDLVEQFVGRRLGADFDRTLAIIYPTELTEDLPLVRLYGEWFSSRGYQVTLGSPYNLTLSDDGRVHVFGNPCAVVLRHYKTDWWGERKTIWKDQEPFGDPDPLELPLGALFEATMEGKACVVNPFGAVVSQNKRLMALAWEFRDRLTPPSRATLDRYLPLTVRLESMHPEQLIFERERWVLKSDYGCEGGEVLVGALTTEADWKLALEQAIAEHWVVQEYFQANVGARGESTNFGVYLLGGQAAGIYARTQVGPTDNDALSVPVLVAPTEEG